MKMIRPLENVMDLATNDAPMDPYTEWTPEGRDLLEYLDNPIFDAAGDTLIATSASGGPIYKMVLSTGVVSTVVESPVSGIAHISISPNESLFAAFGDMMHIYSAVSGNSEYSNTSVKLKLRTLQSWGWQSDSSSFLFPRTSSILSINSSTWQVSTFYDLRDDYPLSEFGASIPSIGASSVGGLTISSGSVFVSAMLTANDSQTTETLYKVVMIKLSLAGVAQGYAGDAPSPDISTLSGRGDIRYIIVPEARGEIVAYEAMNAGKVKVYDVNTLVQVAIPSNLPQSIFIGSPHAIKTTATHLITRSLSTAPYWNYRLLTDYSLDNSLPALPDRGEGIAIGTDYTAVQQNQGIALIQNSDDSIVQQQNPNVTKGDTYIYNEHVYEALTDNNDRPDTGASLATPTWLDRGFINPLRMFDGKLDSVTRAPNNLTVSIDASSLISALAVFNVEAATLRITSTDPVEGLVYDSGLTDMQGGNTVDNWFDYFFAPYIPRADYAVIDLPAYPDAKIEVAMTALNGEVKLGELVLGRAHDLGVAQYGTSVGIIDFSRKETDEFGNFKIVPRRFSKRAEYDVKIDSRRISGVQRTLAGMRSTPAVYIGDIEREETIIYGYYRSFDIVISAPSISDATITVEGL